MLFNVQCYACLQFIRNFLAINFVWWSAWFEWGIPFDSRIPENIHMKNPFQIQNILKFLISLIVNNKNVYPVRAKLVNILAVRVIFWKRSSLEAIELLYVSFLSAARILKWNEDDSSVTLCFSFSRDSTFNLKILAWIKKEWNHFTEICMEGHLRVCSHHISYWLSYFSIYHWQRI